MRCRKIQLNDSKTYYSAEVDFQRIIENETLTRMISNRYQTVKMNVSQIKYFPIGSIWENDTMIRGVDYFETISIYNSALFGKNTRFIIDPWSNYLKSRFHPAIETKSKQEDKNKRHTFPSSLSIYEKKDGFWITQNEKRFKAAFIAFHSYEIARFFLLSIGTYNNKILRSNLMDAGENLLFDNDSTWWTTNQDGDQEIHIKLKEGVPYRRYLNVSDLAGSSKFRKEAMKLQAFLQDRDPFSEIELPIDRFKKMTLSVKRVENTTGEWGLLVMTILSCSGFRNFKQVEVDHEDPSKKKSHDQEVDDWEEEEQDRIQAVNTGTSETYNDEELTNNDLPPIVTPVPPLMAAFAEDSEIVPYEKINELEVVKRPVNSIINEIEANEKALQTEESNRSGTVQPIQFDEGGKIIYNPNAPRDESENSLIYTDRFFQDFEKIVAKISDKLKQTFHNRVSVNYADEHLNFNATPEKFMLRKMKSGHRDPFLYRSVTKQPRRIYLVEFKIDGRFVYLLEPEFRGSTTTTTLTFAKTSKLAATKEELQRFFHIYIQAKGVKPKMESFDFIANQFKVEATNHDIEKISEITVMDESGNRRTEKKNVKHTVKEAIEKHTLKLTTKILKI
jgi:hypothetical protein